MKEQSANLQSAEASRAIQPAFLYYVKRGATEYFLTGYDKPIIVTDGPAHMDDPQEFAVAQIDHNPPEETTEDSTQPTVVSVAAIDPLLRSYFLFPATDEISIEIYRVNSASLPGPISFEDLYLEFKGVCESVAFKGYQIDASFLAPVRQSESIIPRYFYQKTCNHTLGNTFCGVNRELFKLTTTLTAVDRITRSIKFAATSMTVDSPTRSIDIEAETFQGGHIVDASGNKIGVIACEPVSGGTVLWLNYWPGTLTVGATITAYLGCLKIIRVCEDTFQNLENFGGMPYIPASNPATNSLVI